MKNFINNTKGAVTVFVTLLLIPAILISGTAVDLARIHTARSIVQDANGLAANSVLSQYNALLNDLYGLFGVAKNDPVLAELLDEYIRVSVFGEMHQDISMGTLQLFYGSNISIEEIYFTDDKNLRNTDVLRRQIEEYMKFRAPVIIIKEVLDLLGSSSFKEDTGVIGDKLDIDDTIAKIHEKYKELYNAILAGDRCTQVTGGIAGGTVGTVSSGLERIHEQFVDLKKCYENWENVEYPDEEDPKKEEKEREYHEKKEVYAAKYWEILNNIKSLTIGGAVGAGYSQGLNKTITNAISFADRHKPKLDNVVVIARQIDAMKDELSRKIDALENRVIDGDCNDELKEALTGRPGGAEKSLIETYRDILKWDNIEGMANIYKEGGYYYIDVTLKDLLESVIYRNRNMPSFPTLTRVELENILTNSQLNLSDYISAADSLASKLGSYRVSDVTYQMPAGFIKFGEYDGKNKDFFEMLTQMMNQPVVPPVTLFDGQSEASGANTEAKQRGMISELTSLVSTAYAGMFNAPLGAKHINGSAALETDIPDTTDISQSVSQIESHPVSDVISNPYSSAARAGDYLLLLTYCTSMFSNYTTARPEITGRKIDDLHDIGFPKSISGIPISPEVNYFFQSEWEYLYNGNENANKNLSAVSRLIYFVRIICNYITVFSVTEITLIINAIRAAFSWCAPVGILLGELARAAFVAAESAIDLASLRAGYKVPLIKSSSEWICSPRGITKALANVLSDTVNTCESSSDKDLTYSNYMLFFFITKGIAGESAAVELAERTADLIEWNILNYSSGLYCDEEKMSQALSETNRFKMEDMKTDFCLTTTVDMRMLFLSMIFAQNFSDSKSIGMPITMPVTVTDHRGY